jgi:uncharacterized membrane protein YidH (DUF202 family)
VTGHGGHPSSCKDIHSIFFFSIGSSDLRLTLDRNVTLVNERIPRSSSIRAWCLSDAQAQDAQATVVPFNVFEVKLAGNDAMPTGLANAMNDNTIQVATKFSKFLTGAAAFNAVPVLPYWAAHPAFYSFFGIEDRIKNSSTLPLAASSDDYQSMNDSDVVNEDAAVNSMAGTITVGGLTIAPANPARIEPKTYFANERTFIQWLSAAILLLSISGFLLNAGIGTYNATAAVISLTALGLVVYSSNLYYNRLQLLKVREPYGYFNKANPIFLTSVVGLTVFLIWADSMKGSDFLAFFKEEGYSEDRRRVLQQTYVTKSMLRGVEIDSYVPCEAVATPMQLQERPSAVALDTSRGSLLIASGNSIYLQTTKVEGTETLRNAEKLLTIPHAHLRGLASVGDRLFAISESPGQLELMELTWWKSAGDDSHEHLRMTESWSLDEEHRHIRGFTFVPAKDLSSEGTFYIYTSSSIHLFSVPSVNVPDENSLRERPKRLKSLNMKVLQKGRKEEQLSSIASFEGITYIMKSNENVLEAWNMADGTHLSDIELPLAHEGWTDFAFERSTDSIFLHLLTSTTEQVSQIWRVPVQGDMQAPTTTGRFSVSNCEIVMN